MTHAKVAPRLYNSISSLNDRFFSSLAAGTSLLLLSFFMGLSPSALAQEILPESATANLQIYHTRFRLDPSEGLHEVAIEGKVRFSPDETKIAWMDDGAYVRIITIEDGLKMRFDATPDQNGLPTVSHKLDGQPRPYDEAASRYLADTLPVVFRELAFDEVSRVKKTYGQSGATGVFLMISKIRSDFSASRHAAAFMALEDLTDDEIIDCFSLVGQQINSDSELTDLLFKMSGLYTERPGVRDAYLNCLNHFQSKIERSRTTKNLFGLESIATGELPTMVMPEGC